MSWHLMQWRILRLDVITLKKSVISIIFFMCLATLCFYLIFTLLFIQWNNKVFRNDFYSNINFEFNDNWNHERSLKCRFPYQNEIKDNIFMIDVYVIILTTKNVWFQEMWSIGLQKIVVVKLRLTGTRFGSMAWSCFAWKIGNIIILNS